MENGKVLWTFPHGTIFYVDGVVYSMKQKTTIHNMIDPLSIAVLASDATTLQESPDRSEKLSHTFGMNLRDARRIHVTVTLD